MPRPTPYLGSRISVRNPTTGRFQSAIAYHNPRTGQRIGRADRARIEVEDTAENYIAALQHFKDLTGVNVRRLMTGHVLEHVRRVQMRTPVRTGRARNSYHAVLPGTRDTFMYQDRAGRTFDGSLGISTGPAEAAAGSNVNYFLQLEAGSSRQAPQGMVAVTLKEMTSELEVAIIAEVQRIWNTL